MGVSKPYVTQLVQAGKLVLDPKTKLLDFEASRQLLDATKSPERSSVRVANAAQRQQAAEGLHPNQQKKVERVEASKPGKVAPRSSSASSPASVALLLNKAKADKERSLAELKKLELEKERGLLIPLADVRADAEAVAAQLRTQLFALAPRLAPRLEGLKAGEIEAMITDEINNVLKALHESAYISPPGQAG